MVAIILRHTLATFATFNEKTQLQTRLLQIGLATSVFSNQRRWRHAAASCSARWLTGLVLSLLHREGGINFERVSHG